MKHRTSKWKLTAEALALSERIRHLRTEARYGTCEGARIERVHHRAWERYVRRLGAWMAEKHCKPGTEELLVTLAPMVKAQFRNPTTANPNAGIVPAYPKGRW